MNSSKTLFLVPAAFGLLLVGALGAGACSSSTSITIPTASTAPAGTTFIGGTFDGSCTGDVYAQAGVGWAFCDDDKWEYTTTDPSTDGYKEFSEADAGDDANEDNDANQGDDSGKLNDASDDDGDTQGDDASKGDDGGQQGGDDGGQQGGGDDGGQQGIDAGGQQGH